MEHSTLPVGAICTLLVQTSEHSIQTRQCSKKRSSFDSVKEADENVNVTATMHHGSSGTDYLPPDNTVEMHFLAYAEDAIDEGWYGLGNRSYGIGLSETLLPDRGRYEGANYRVTLTFHGLEQDIETQIGSTSTTIELSCEVTSTTVDFLAEGNMQGYIPIHEFESTDNHPAVEWEPSDCHVVLQLDYDPGMSCTPSRIEQDPPLDPDLDYTTQLTPDIQIDYRGRVTGTATEQRFPKAIDHCLLFDDLAIVGLDPDSDGFDDPSFQYEKAQNLVAIDSTGQVAWVAEPATSYEGDRGYYYTLWRIDDSLFAKVRGLGKAGRMTVELNPETGERISTIS